MLLNLFPNRGDHIQTAYKKWCIDCASSWTMPRTGSQEC